MSEPLRYSVGGMGALLVVFAVFLLLWRRFDKPRGERSDAVALVLLAVGASCLALALWGPGLPENGAPTFLQE